MATGSVPRIAPVKDWVGVSAPMAPRLEARQPGGARAPRWPAARLAAVEALWGDGFNAPGGAAQVLRLSSPLALGADDKLLLLGGGLGGPACAIAQDCGAWVSHYEADPELAALAHTRIGAHGCADRILVTGWDLDHPDFGVRASNHAVSLEALRGADPVATLNSVACSLRPRSQIVMTEMVTDRLLPASDREFAAWCRLENRLPDLPRGDAITAALTRLGYDVRVVEDVSSAHVSEALAGWRQAVRAMAQGPSPSAAAASVVVTEAELWLLRIRVMRRFGFRLLRWHAVSVG
jgi:hypothetical protein